MSRHPVQTSSLINQIKEIRTELEFFSFLY